MLRGKVAIVTGAAGGIGQAYARALAQAGAAVVIADLNAKGAEQVAAKLSGDGLRAIGVGVDITSPESAKAMAAKAKEAFGGVDILVNNAALMAEIPRAPLAQFPIDWFDRVMKVNCTGALICSQAVVPSMIERGGGKIINQSSGGAFECRSAYGVSKLALVGLTVGLAKELGAHKINVNAIAPGAIDTEAGFRSAPKGSAFRAKMQAQAAIQSLGRPEDLCGALLYLASPASDYMTGQCLSVDGGWIMRL
ncbi:MAG: SDR family oxidoreductase [Chloroflexi bacterium]|nr:SDR family oxidoreductase [Chloroflexota bacterium]